MVRAEAEKLEVHEWGTFTMVSGSDGVALPWYVTQRSASPLPRFVQSNPSVGGKLGPLSPDLVRMETPVIYFYPERPMHVTVKAEFLQGRLTEWFPKPAEAREGATWRGELIAPDRSDAFAKIPRIEDEVGAHYAHAREVPDAWIFHPMEELSTPNVRSTNRPGAAPDSAAFEKFIFYRGAGSALPALRVMPWKENEVLLFSEGENPAVTAFALQVSDLGVKWVKLPLLPAYQSRQGGPLRPHVEAAFNGEPQAPAEAEAGLAEAMTQSLREAGLTSDEAKAMVATWRDLWFREKGTRVLAILPRPWVDSVLPLTITPAPHKLTRVFVGRFELFTGAREQSLLALLDHAERPTTASVNQFNALGLGRFAYAALRRVEHLQSMRNAERFARLEEAAAVPPATAAR